MKDHLPIKVAIIWLGILVLWIFYKWAETNGYKKCANDVPRAFREAIAQSEGK